MTRSTVTHSHSKVSENGGSPDRRIRTSRSVLFLRILFFLTLCVVAVVFGVAADYFLTQSEADLAETQFISISDRALNTARGITQRKRLGAVTMASVAAHDNPDISAWPFITINGFEEVASNVIDTSSGREMGFAPIVRPDQLIEFEEFAYNFYENDRVPPMPNGTAVSSFGRGVFGINPTLGTSDNRYHVTPETKTYYESPNDVFTPLLHINSGPHPVLMLNLRFEETRGKAIDNIIACSNQRAQGGDSINCGVVSDKIILSSPNDPPSPGALMFQPVYPANNPTELAGVVASSIVWAEVLEGVFGDSVRGIDCVIETDTQAFTYHVVNGDAILKDDTGDGDLHVNDFDEYRQTISLTGDDFFGPGSANYTMTLYPTEEFFAVYSTTNPLAASIGAVLVILFTSMLFLVYDFVVRKEVNAKKDLLEAKRRFVRFVSHEVRTPLNSVCMGLTLLKEEMGMAVAANLKRDANNSLTPAVEEHPRRGSITQEKRIESLTEEWLGLTDEVLISAQSSVDVLNDLLNYDKIEMGSLKLELTVIPIWKLIDETTKEFLLPATKKKIEVSVDFGQVIDPETGVSSEGLPSEVQEQKVVGDSVRLAQVMRNLLSNALKFTSEQGTVSVQSSWIKNHPVQHRNAKNNDNFVLKNGEEVDFEWSGKLKVSVTDSGAGMSEAQLKSLFSAGVQFNVNDLQAGQGSGLGLHIAKGIVEQHGGTLEATSPGLGKGTTFTMTLPLYNVPEPECRKAEESYGIENVPTGPVEPVSLRILIVDDALTNRKLLRRLLQNHGHVCDEAENGQIGVDKVAEAMEAGEMYDTILLDYEMPVMNGPDAAMAMRGMGSDTFIVGITGNVLEEDVSLFKACGANGVLPKPFKLKDLVQLWVEYGVEDTRVLPLDSSSGVAA